MFWPALHGEADMSLLIPCLVGLFGVSDCGRVLLERIEGKRG